MSSTAMVLCAGYGTRLRPLTDELPKPLVPIGDDSVLGHIAAALAQAGYRRLVINTHHLAEKFDTVVDGLALPVEQVHETRIAGTAGGVAGAAAQLGGGDLLVCNGDILAELDLPALAAQHVAAGAGATLAVVGGAAPGDGTVGMASDGAVVRLRQVRRGHETSSGWFVGAQILGAALRRRLPAAGCLVGDVYLPALQRGERLQAAAVARCFDDVGSPAAYLAANGRWLKARGLDSYRAPGSTLAGGVVLERVVMGAGARLDGSGTVRNTVLWPGAQAQAPLSGAVVTTAGRVVLSAAPASPP